MRKTTKRKPAGIADVWVIEKDEFHPNPKVAAKYADENARAAAIEWLSAQIKKLGTRDEPLSVEDSALLVRYRSALVLVKEEQEEADADADSSNS